MSDPRGQRATLRLFRFCLALAVMVVLGTWLASTLTEQQQAAQQANWQAQWRQLALQTQWLHGRWLNEHHASTLWIPARDGQPGSQIAMSATGWPQASPADGERGCLQLWQQLQERVSGATSVQAAAEPQGCRYQQGETAWVYSWLDGNMTVVSAATGS